jgi:cytochrome c-type biogenesis protein
LENFHLAALAALSGGILSFISPCVLPLVPGYLCFAAGLNFDDLTDNKPDLRRRIVQGALFFVLGFSVVFIALGASASALSGLLLDHKVLLSQIAGIVIIAFGIHLTGLLKFAPLLREIRISAPMQTSATSPYRQYGIAFIIGLAFAFGWTPCIGPILATILTLAAGRDSMSEGIILLSLYAAGLGIPFVLAAMSVGRFLSTSQRLRRHLPLIEKLAGGLLIVTGALILAGTLQTLASYLLDWFPALSRLG